MVRALAQIVRGVGLSPTWCYFFLAYVLLKNIHLFTYYKANGKRLVYINLFHVYILDYSLYSTKLKHCANSMNSWYIIL